jgi:transcriptional regulator with XRE-family HTH domain
VAHFSAHRLRALSQDADLTREQVAHQLGKTVGTITKYELGTIVPTVHVLGDFARIFQIDVGELFDADDPNDAVTSFAAEIRAMVDQAPPFTAAQAARLRVLLRGVA